MTDCVSAFLRLPLGCLYRESGSGIQPRVEAWRNPGVSKDLITLRYSVSHLPNVQNY